jgi:hypothetical protein
MKGAEHIRRAKSVMDYICDRIDVSANRRHISELVERVVSDECFEAVGHQSLDRRATGWRQALRVLLAEQQNAANNN